MDDLVALIIREGVSKKQFRVEDVRTTARAISGMISYTYSWWRSDRRLSRDDIADYYAGVALRIVGAADPDGGALRAAAGRVRASARAASRACCAPSPRPSFPPGS